jgi:hypothetical protein
MTVNTWIKAAAIRYAAVVIVAGAVLVGCILSLAFVGQKLDNRAREGNQEQIDAKYLHPAQAAHKRGDMGAYERLMEQYHRANERNYAD